MKHNIIAVKQHAGTKHGTNNYDNTLYTLSVETPWEKLKIF